MAFEIILKGRVQGVGCRYYCGNVVQKMNLHGSASNMPDGSVQVIVQTDRREIAESCAHALQYNTFNIAFFGRIETAAVHQTGLAVRGDYEW
jgi:acylphosphatase